MTCAALNQTSSTLATLTRPRDRHLADLLRNAADELFQLSGIGAPLHALIERQMGGSDLQDQSIEDAQLIDFLVQHLEATGIFLRELAKQTPPDVLVEFERVRNKVPLADLGRRLGGEGPAEDSSATSGDLDLF